MFIPLNFATFFLGMNLEQLGTGHISIGYFFLLAFFTGCLALTLSSCLKPFEEGWYKAELRYAKLHWHLVEDVRKREGIWSIVRGYIPELLLERLEKRWFRPVKTIYGCDRPGLSSFIPTSKILWHMLKSAFGIASEKAQESRAQPMENGVDSPPIGGEP